jgi:hypothetical protein
MVTLVQLAQVGGREAWRLLRRPLRSAEVPGLRDSETLLTAPLGPALLPRVRLDRVGVLSVWDDDAAVDSYIGAHPVAAAMTGGYRVRLRPTRVAGEWGPIGPIPVDAGAEGDGPVAVVTLGRLRPARALPFLRASSRAEHDALASPALILSSGLARPPRTVATFSMWRGVDAMRDYVDRANGGHRGATGRHARRPFHSESAFIRFRPYDAAGQWPPAAG